MNVLKGLFHQKCLIFFLGEKLVMPSLVHITKDGQYGHKQEIDTSENMDTVETTPRSAFNYKTIDTQ